MSLYLFERMPEISASLRQVTITGIQDGLHRRFIPKNGERVNNLFSNGYPAMFVSYGTKTTRKPTLLLRLWGLLLLRFTGVHHSALLFHEPPRITRFEPTIITLYYQILSF
jgi:hypothetical protein